MIKRKIQNLSGSSDSESDNYEKQRAERIARKKKMLQELNIVESVEKVVKLKPVKKSISEKVSSEPTVRRSSMRISAKVAAGKSPDYKDTTVEMIEEKPSDRDEDVKLSSSDSDASVVEGNDSRRKFKKSSKADSSSKRKQSRKISCKAFTSPEEMAESYLNMPRRKGHFGMSDVANYPCEDVMKSVKPHLTDIEINLKFQDSDFLLQQYMKLKPIQVTKLVPNRILSMAVHPSQAKTLIVAGDRNGYVGMWVLSDKLSEDQTVCLWHTNYRSVNHITFSRAKPECFYFTSLDGSVRCGNIESSVFEEIYACDEDDSSTSWHSFTSEHNLLVGRDDGTVAMVDTRTPRTISERLYECSGSAQKSNSIKCVDVHPVHNQYFVTSSQRGDVFIWDERFLSEAKPGSKNLNYIISLPHFRSVPSARFSPLTGNRLLTSCVDNNFRIYDTSTQKCASLLKTFYHNNKTGRWLTPFKPEWHPANDEVYVSGSLDFPRRVEVFRGLRSQPVHTYQGGMLASVCSINAFHPSKSLMAAANSSGRVHLMM